MHIDIGYAKVAGLVSLTFCDDDVNLHLLPAPDDWQWGYSESWFDGPLVEIGFGPLALVCIDGKTAGTLWSLVRRHGLFVNRRFV